MMDRGVSLNSTACCGEKSAARFSSSTLIRTLASTRESRSVACLYFLSVASQRTVRSASGSDTGTCVRDRTRKSNLLPVG